MLLPKSRTNEYDELVKKNKKVSIFSILSLVIGLLLAAIMVVVAIVVKNYVPGIFAGVFALAGLIATLCLQNAFKRNTQKIIDKYLQAYGVEQPSGSISYMGDNYGLGQALFSKHLICWVSSFGNSLKFISQNFLRIKEEKFFNRNYKAWLNTDFGVLDILITNIDSYMQTSFNAGTGFGSADTVLIVHDNGQVRRITFNNAAFFDAVIPTYEYHYKTAKKS